MNIIRTEPAVVVGAATAIVGLLIAFGAPISEQQKEAVISCVIALIPVIIMIRQLVFAPATVEKLEQQAAVTGQVTPDLKPPAGH